MRSKRASVNPLPSSSFVDLEKVRRFRVPVPMLDDTRTALRHWGCRHEEGRVLWAGNMVDRSTFQFSRILVPRQDNTYFSTSVSHAEIERMNLGLYEEELILAGQVHTHPATAFHSDLDDEMAICAQRGSLSLVVPFFARASLNDLHRVAVYRLEESAWRLLEGPEAHGLIEVHEEDS